MLKDYLVVAQEALSAQKEIYQVKQQRLELAQQEYQQLHAVWEHKLGSQVSCEYLSLLGPIASIPCTNYHTLYRFPCYFFPLFFILSVYARVCVVSTGMC